MQNQPQYYRRRQGEELLRLDTMGLFTSEMADIPLTKVQVSAKIIHFVADVEVQLSYLNDFGEPIEAVFKFEHLNAALSNFEVEVKGKKHVGICKEKNEVLQDYDDAIASGKGAYMIEDVRYGQFMVSVGNLPPDSECRLSFRYVVALTVEEDLIKFSLPITSTPIHKIDNTSYGVSILVDVLTHTEIEKISCSHPVDIKKEGNKALVACKSLLRKEFDLSVHIQDLHEPVHFVELFSKGEASEEAPFYIPAIPASSPIDKAESVPPASLITFIPKIQTEDEIYSEIIFLVDRSGSMAGAKMNQAKNALQLFLRSLPQNSLLNIVSFGSTYSSLWKQSLTLTSETLEQATQHVAEMKADMGGTELLAPIKNILNQFRIFKEKDFETYQNFPKQIFCLTDGEVSNTNEILSYLKRNIGDARLFTFGIGAEASKELVSGMAKFGKGKAEYVKTSERIESKVIKQLRKALLPILKNIKVNWNGLESAEFSTITKHYPPIFDGERILIFCNLSEDENVEGKQITITGTTGKQIHEWQLPRSDKHVIQGTTIHRLSAMSYILELQRNAKKNKEKIVQLGTDWGLVTKYTSYIAIEDRDIATYASMKTINIQQVNGNTRRSHFDDVNIDRVYVQESSSCCGGGGSSYSPPPSDLRVVGHTTTPAPLGGLDDENDIPLYLPTALPSKKPAQETSAHLRDIDHFILLQNVNGSFKLNDKFLKYSHTTKSMNDITSSVPLPVKKVIPTEEEQLALWTTALAVVVFEKEYADLKDEWIMIYEKGYKYLKLQLSQISKLDPSFSLSELIQSASLFLQ